MATLDAGARGGASRSTCDYGLFDDSAADSPLETVPPVVRSVKLAVVTPMSFLLPLHLGTGSADVAVVHAESVRGLGGLRADAYLVLPAPRAPSAIGVAPGLYYLTTGDGACAPSCAELPRPEVLEGLAADVFALAARAGVPCTAVACLTGPSGSASERTLREIMAAALQAAGGLVHGDTGRDVEGLVPASSVEEEGSATQGALRKLAGRMGASPLAHTVVRMYA